MNLKVKKRRNFELRSRLPLKSSCMDSVDPNLHNDSKKHHFISVDIKIIGGGNHPPLNILLQKKGHVD